MKTKTDTSITPLEGNSIQRVVHDGYVTITREIKLPYNGQQYTSNGLSITVSRPTLEEATAELQVAQEHLYKELALPPSQAQTDELALIKARVEKQNAFLATIKSHPVIGPIFLKELNAFNTK